MLGRQWSWWFDALAEEMCREEAKAVNEKIPELTSAGSVCHSRPWMRYHASLTWVGHPVFGPEVLQSGFGTIFLPGEF